MKAKQKQEEKSVESTIAGLPAVKRVSIEFHEDNEKEELSIAYRDSGKIDKDGKTKQVLVLIHGNSGGSIDFLEQFKALGDKYRVLAFDLPGHGDSSYPKLEKFKKLVYSFKGYAKSIAQALDSEELSTNSFHLCGVSLGGHIALSLMNDKDASKKVRSLTISGTPALNFNKQKKEDIYAEFAKGFNRSLPSEQLKQWDMQLPELLGFPLNLDTEEVTLPKNKLKVESRLLAEQFISGQGIFPKSSSPENSKPFQEVSKEFYDDKIENARKTQGDARRYMMENFVICGENQFKTACELNIPLQIISAKNDDGIKFEHCRDVAKAAKAEFIPVENGGHAIFATNPNIVNDNLDSFIQSIEKQKVSGKPLALSSANSEPAVKSKEKSDQKSDRIDMSSP